MGVVDALRARLEPWRRPFRGSLRAGRRADLPWVATGLVTAIALTALATGVLARDLPSSVAGRGAFGWPSLVAGRWWTVVTSFVLTRDWFMAATMPIALFLALAPYERRVGHGRAFAVAALGHVTGSVIVALASGALGWTGRVVLVRAGQNLDYGASMAVAAALGALVSRLGNRRLSLVAFIGVVVAVPLHHQMADWGHLVALPAGFLADRVRRPRWATAAFAGAIGLTAVLTLYGPWAVNTAVQAIRFGDQPAEAAAVTGSTTARGTVSTLTYQAGALEQRPEVARVYVPARAAVRSRGSLPVVVFLHGIPGTGDDWMVGGSVDRLLDQRIAAGSFPPVIAVFPTADGFHDPAAGWQDVPHQQQLGSIRRDLLPLVARRYHADISPGSVAVVGVGGGGDGALALGHSDRRIGFVVALHPRAPVTESSVSGPALYVYRPARRAPGTGGRPLPAAARWARWRSDIPGALDWLDASGFGAQVTRL